jgi:hypothetical protein
VALPAGGFAPGQHRFRRDPPGDRSEHGRERGRAAPRSMSCSCSSRWPSS